MSGASPVLFVGGAHKSGTTALFTALAQHPRLIGQRASELPFFVEDDEYRQGFGARAWLRHVPPQADGRGFVAKHVKLFYRREALERLHDFAPGALLVLVLRHPVERAHSAFWHARSHGREEAATFEQALQLEDARVSAGRAPWHDTAYVHNGCYARPLADAFEVFGRERVRVFLLQELRAEPEGLVRGLFDELGVDASFRPDLERGANRASKARSQGLARWMGRVFDSRARAKRVVRALLPDRLAVSVRHALVRLNTQPLQVPPLRSETRTRLLERFRESNARVARLLGRELSGWNA